MFILSKASLATHVPNKNMSVINKPLKNNKLNFLWPRPKYIYERDDQEVSLPPHLQLDVGVYAATAAPLPLLWSNSVHNVTVLLMALSQQFRCIVMKTVRCHSVAKTGLGPAVNVTQLRVIVHCTR